MAATAVAAVAQLYVQPDVAEVAAGKPLLLVRRGLAIVGLQEEQQNCRSSIKEQRRQENAGGGL